MHGTRKICLLVCFYNERDDKECLKCKIYCIKTQRERNVWILGLSAYAGICGIKREADKKKVRLRNTFASK